MQHALQQYCCSGYADANATLLLMGIYVHHVLVDIKHYDKFMVHEVTITRDVFTSTSAGYEDTTMS